MVVQRTGREPVSKRRSGPIRFRCPTCRTLLGLADRMAGEEVTCPRCGQRVLTPAHRRPPERALPGAGPPPLPRQSIFPEFPVVLEPPEPGLRVGLPVADPPPERTRVKQPWQARLVALFLIVGGVWAFVHVIGFLVLSGAVCCFWPGMLPELPWGVTAIVRGGQLLFARDRPRVPAIVVGLQLLTCGAFDLVNTLLGVLNVLLICSPAARRYYRNEWGEAEAAEPDSRRPAGPQGAPSATLGSGR